MKTQLTRTALLRSVVFILALVLFFVGFTSSSVAPALAVSPNIVISQVYGGGGGWGTIYTTMSSYLIAVRLVSLLMVGHFSTARQRVISGAVPATFMHFLA